LPPETFGTSLTGAIRNDAINKANGIKHPAEREYLLTGRKKKHHPVAVVN